MEYNYQFQSEKKEARVSVSHAIVPLTIKQVKSLTKDNEIEHQQFQHIAMIGKLVSCRLQNTKYKIVLSDSTGNIDLTQLTGGDKKKGKFVVGEDLNNQTGKYFFVVCTAKLKKESSEWIYFLDNIREITNHNEVTKHLSDVILSYLERTH